ncbi:MAG: hypothetical protein F6K21_16910 [Symploca sp. SIO2D2]|nr:hypothetical protein [Symploca sp. SIO2D2]
MSLEIALTNIQLLLARPEAADLRKIHHYAAARNAPIEEVSYIVKLYTQTPLPNNSMGVELYVGSQQIRKYSQFKNGIYFKVNDSQQLSSLQGEEVRFRRPGADEFLNTGVRVPAKDTIARSRRTVVGEIIQGSQASAEVNQLPTQEELLRE